MSTKSKQVETYVSKTNRNAISTVATKHLSPFGLQSDFYQTRSETKMTFEINSFLYQNKRGIFKFSVHSKNTFELCQISQRHFSVHFLPFYTQIQYFFVHPALVHLHLNSIGFIGGANGLLLSTLFQSSHDQSSFQFSPLDRHFQKLFIHFDRFQVQCTVLF